MYSLAIILLIFFSSTCFAQSVQPSNNTRLNTTSPDDIVLFFSTPRAQSQPITVLPLIPTALLTPGDKLQGKVALIYPSNSTVTLNGLIPLIACDPNSYEGYISARDVLSKLVLQTPEAIILFSISSQGCSFINTPDYTLPADYHSFYSLTSQEDTNMVLQRISYDAAPYVTLETRQTQANNTGGSGGAGGGAFNSTQTSPTTAVAMIILYSITGVITALFLVIIVTGAVRAHRHPERYGPRAGHGRPRQSRAKGLARAMLDTLPIVKWGEKDGDKPDVELAAGAPREGILVADDKSDNDADTVQEGEGEDGKNKDKGPITNEPTPPVEENLGCSICTDDFEKGQDVRVLPCNHQFHPACIDPWLLNVSGTCPLCRIDLRPEAARSETGSDLPPPLEDMADRRSSRRQSIIWEFLNPRLMRDATPQQRIAALRRVQEERRTTPAEEAEARRRRRMSTRLQDVFSVRTTRNRSPGQSDGEPSSNVGAIQETQAEHEPTHSDHLSASNSATQVPLPISPSVGSSHLNVPSSNASISPAPSSPIPESSTTAAARAPDATR